MERFDVIIIGGGAAGIIAALTSSMNGRKTAIFEHNSKLGKKLLITGKGRCNLTNNCDNSEFMNSIPTNSKFLYSSLNMFSPADTISYFENLGVPLKTERGKRVFPVSDKALDIVLSLEKAVKSNNITVKFKKATGLILESNKCLGIKCGNEEYYAESVLIATGGCSYPLTGSTGDGYIFAKLAGHTVTQLKPSLVPIVTEEEYCAEMMGLSLKNVTLSLIDKKSEKCIYKELGEMLFTHFGVSGPLVLSASSHISNFEKERYSLLIDLKPGLMEEKLDLRLQKDFSEMLNRNFENSLSKVLPNKITPILVKLSGIDPETKVNQITKEQRHNLVKLIKNFPLNVKAFRPIEEAIITSGGVSVKEINPKTMESKLVKGLYFAGEVIDIDGYTGGFNLQIAFSTGYTAGLNM